VNGSGRYRTAAFDHLSDNPARTEECVASHDAVLIFDGLFLHRPELCAYWDFSIFLDGSFDITVPRGAPRVARASAIRTHRLRPTAGMSRAT
jgi:uridine kinase